MKGDERYLSRWRDEWSEMIHGCGHDPVRIAAFIARTYKASVDRGVACMRFCMSEIAAPNSLALAEDLVDQVLFTGMMVFRRDGIAMFGKVRDEWLCESEARLFRCRLCSNFQHVLNARKDGAVRKLSADPHLDLDDIIASLWYWGKAAETLAYWLEVVRPDTRVAESLAESCWKYPLELAVDVLSRPDAKVAAGMARILKPAFIAQLGEGSPPKWLSQVFQRIALAEARQQSVPYMAMSGP